MTDEREAEDDEREANDEPEAADGREVTDDGNAHRSEDREHLADFDGCAGCVEVWEHLSEQREAAADEEPGRGSAE